MKTFLVILALGLMASMAQAANPARGAKNSVTVNYTATVSSVSIPGPAVVYSIITSTGATGDYFALFDTSTVIGVTAALTTTSVLKTRCMVGSTITTTTCSYDPPLQFNLGVAGIASTAANQALIVYEKGRVTQGY